MTDENKDSKDIIEKGISEDEMLTWADIRAGKHRKGWPGEPENTGDPYDPENMERTDASVIVNKGRVLLNLTGLISASVVSRRRQAIMLVMFVFWTSFIGITLKNASYSSFYEFYESVEFSIPKIPALSSDDIVVESSDNKGKELNLLLSHHYSKTDQGFASDYDLQNILARHKAIKAVCGRNVMDCYKKMELADIADAFSKAAEDKNNYVSYYSDRSSKSSDLEEALELSRYGINSALGKPENGVWGEEQKSRFCSNTSRAYLETRHHSETAHAISSMRDRWKRAGGDDPSDFSVKHLPTASSFSELVSHQVKRNPDCKVNDIVILPVKSGAIKYLISYAGRVSNNGGKIGTALYALAELDDDNVMVKVACNNCEMQGLSESENTGRNILDNIDKSAKGVIRAIKRSGLETNIDKLNNSEGV